VLFTTFFVYGSNGTPTWFVGPDVEQFGGTSGFQGTLYQTTGPYYGAATFNPGSVTSRTVGTITFTPTSATTATVAYSVDGTQVTKQVQRQTWRSENLAGIYLGASTGTWSNCGASRNGYDESYATYTVAQDGISVNFREDTAGGSTCTYTGTYTASGRLGTIVGTGLCSDGVNQTFTASEVQVSQSALTMKFQASQVGGCIYNGRLGGLRRAP